MTEKSNLLDIDRSEELAAIRAHKAGKDALRTKKLEAPSDVAAIRHHLGLTQQAFSGLMGISVQTLHNFVSGKVLTHQLSTQIRSGQSANLPGY